MSEKFEIELNFSVKGFFLEINFNFRVESVCISSSKLHENSLHIFYYGSQWLYVYKSGDIYVHQKCFKYSCISPASTFALH